MPYSSLGDVIRSFFGVPPSQSTTRDFDDQWHSSRFEDNDDTHRGQSGSGDLFDLFGESMDMHRAFQREFEDIMRIFGDNMFGSFSGGQHPAIDDGFYEERPIKPERSIRDEYFKPGYSDNSKSNQSPSDSDLDGKIPSNQLEQFFDKDQRRPRTFHSPDVFSGFSGNSFSRVIITESITKPDGTTETRRTVRDSRNNDDETTVTITGLPVQPRSDGPENMWEKFFGKS